MQVKAENNLNCINFFEKSQKPRVFHLPPSSDFSLSFVNGILSRFQHSKIKEKPHLLARLKIFTNTNRSCRRIETVFKDLGLVILPQINQIENLSNLMPQVPIEKMESLNGLYKAQIISRLEKFVAIEKFTNDYLIEKRELMVDNFSFNLADGLVNLLDEMNTSYIPLARLRELDADEFSEHWQASLKVLRTILFKYQEWAKEYHILDSNLKYISEALAIIKHWTKHPYLDPIIIVGSTGSRYATAKLMNAVSNLPQGAVVLPGLDPFLNARAWSELTPDHPQYGFISLAKKWGLEGNQKNLLLKSPSWLGKSGETNTHRMHFFSLVMQPAKVTDEWINELHKSSLDLKEALSEVTLIEAENSRQEAAAIAVSIRESVENERSVALITPDQTLCRRVTAELQRWCIIPDNSLGGSLAFSDLGIFIRQSIKVFNQNFDIQDFLILLKHPLCLTDDRSYHLENLKILESSAIVRGSINQNFNLDELWISGQGVKFSEWFYWLKSICLKTVCFSEDRSFKVLFETHKYFLNDLISGPKFIEKEHIKSYGYIWGTAIGTLILKEIDCLIRLSGQIRELDIYAYGCFLEKLLRDSRSFPKSLNSHPSVHIWGTLESRTQTADVFILAGLNEGLWPEKSLDDQWLTRSMRSKLGMSLLERKIGLSAHDFQQASMAKTLVISRSLSQEGAPSIASRWLIRVENFLIGLGEKGINSLFEIRSRGNRLLQLAIDINQDEFFVMGLPEMTRTPASRPAPCPSVEKRPKKLPITQINTLIRNPYAIYAKYVLNLKKLNDLSDSDDPKDIGILFHKVMENFVGETFKKLPPMKLSMNLLEKKFEEIFSVFRGSPEKLIYWRSKFKDRIEEIIKLEQVRRQEASPFALEVYGKYVITYSDGYEFTIVGKADRIDKNIDGFVIYDYKTGGVSQEMVRAFSPQLDIEAIMLNNGGFKGVPKGKVVGLSLISLSNKPTQVQSFLIDPVLNERREALEKKIEGLIFSNQPFIARVHQIEYKDDYHHLSRYGEWFDGDDYDEVFLNHLELETS